MWITIVSVEANLINGYLFVVIINYSDYFLDVGVSEVCFEVLCYLSLNYSIIAQRLEG